MKTYKLFTIGYEGRNIEEFISQLKDFNITRLIDVRKIPLFRKKGFSKPLFQGLSYRRQLSGQILYALPFFSSYQSGQDSQGF